MRVRIRGTELQPGDLVVKTELGTFTYATCALVVSTGCIDERYHRMLVLSLGPRGELFEEPIYSDEFAEVYRRRA